MNVCSQATQVNSDVKQHLATRWGCVTGIYLSGRQSRGFSSYTCNKVLLHCFWSFFGCVQHKKLCVWQLEVFELWVFKSQLALKRLIQKEIHSTFCVRLVPKVTKISRVVHLEHPVCVSICRCVQRAVSTGDQTQARVWTTRSKAAPGGNSHTSRVYFTRILTL